MKNTVNNPDDRTEGAAREPLAPLVDLVAAIDEANLLNVDLPLEMPGLLEGFLDPDVQTALPTELRVAADAYLDGLPGYRAGDVVRASVQHRLRIDLWNSEAMRVGEDEIEDLGLEEEPEDG
ncbi:MAG: hypothetical protein U1F59_00665 [Candidatus Competibacteraceae bacterium]